MQTVLGSARISLAAVALLLIAGCAQPSGSGVESRDGSGSGDQIDTLLSMTPVDRWESGVKRQGGTVLYANAGTATAIRDAVLLLGCASDEKSVVLMVTPKRKLGLDPSIRPVTIILDGDMTLTQDWQSSAASYWTGNSDPGFAALLETLKTHKAVEFVLGAPGHEIDRRHFTLNGAARPIEDVMSNCAKKV